MNEPRTAFHDPLAEKAVLASAILNPWAIDDLIAILKPEHFYSPLHGRVLAILATMRIEGTPIDQITVGIEFDKSEKVTGGSKDFLFDVMSTSYHGANATYYAKEIVGRWRRRMAAAAVEKMGFAIRDQSSNFDETTALCESELRAIQEHGQPQESLAIGDMLEACLEEKNRCCNGLKTGFETVDEMTTGMYPAQLIVIAARTTIGKSALAGNIATNLAQRGDGVLFVTLEMSKTDVIYRLVARFSGLLMKEIRNNNIAFHSPILDAMNLMNRWPLFIDDAVPQTVSHIGATTRKLIRSHGIKLVVIDYLQLVTPSDRKAPREQQISGITRDLKMLAKNARIPIIALSQLNRANDKENRAPRLTDLRESGAIEQDADAVWLIHRPGMSDATRDDNDAEWIVAKNRQGPQGKVKMEWDGRKFMFSEKEDQSGSDFP